MSSSRRKILFVIPSLEAGGAERVFSLLLAHLDRTDFEPHLALLQTKGPFLSEIPSDVVIHDLKTARVRSVLPALVRLIREIRPHAVLSTMGHLNLALLMVRPLMPRGTRVLVREVTIVETFLKEGTRSPKLWAWLYRRFYKRADKVICLSDAMMNDLAVNFGVPREKLVRIFNPVDVEKIRKLAESGTHVPGIARPRLITVGRLSPEKGLDILLEAMPAIVKSFPDTQLTILGEGPLLHDLRDQTKRLGLEEHVQFLGFQMNPWSYMKSADVLVLPSRFEGVPNVVVEALALGMRIVATDCPGGLRDLLNCDFGIVLAPSENPRALADAIVSIFSLAPENSENRKAPPNLAMFDLRQVVEEYSKLLLS